MRPTMPNLSSQGISPNDARLQPISEAQFEALIRCFEVVETEKGTAYEKAGKPWRFVRQDRLLIVTHRLRTKIRYCYEIL